MTIEYGRQGPVPFAVNDPFAATLHWNHSILDDRDFVSEWQAQTLAFDLAEELGCSGFPRIDVLSLPLRKKPSRRTVHFS